jgi:hypothetical protein
MTGPAEVLNQPAFTVDPKPSLLSGPGAALDLLTGAVVCVTVMPGFLVCIPGIVLATFILLIPVAAVALLVCAAMLAVTPVLVVRHLVRLAKKHSTIRVQRVSDEIPDLLAHDQGEVTLVG